MSECRQDHRAMTTQFCPDCGTPNAVQREPGEIVRMRAVVKGLLDEAPRSARLSGLLYMIATDCALAWAAGEMTDDKYVNLARAAIAGKD